MATDAGRKKREEEDARNAIAELNRQKVIDVKARMDEAGDRLKKKERWKYVICLLWWL